MIDPTGGWAKATEKSAEAATEATRAASGFGKALYPIWEPLIGTIGDQLQLFRAERQFHLHDRYMEKMRMRGLDRPTRKVSPTFLVPLLEHASLESDNALQDVWAVMLANASDANNRTEMRSAFIGILSQMTHFDVLILSKLHNADPDNKLSGVGVAGFEDENLSTEDVMISLVNIQRLGCLFSTSLYPKQSLVEVKLTFLGKAFIEACSDRS